MENKYNIEGLKRIYKCFLGDKGVEYVENNYSEASNNVIKFYEAMKPTLEENEAYIIDKSFGINNIQMTYPELAKKLNITEEKVREIAAIAIRKLKHPSRARIGYALLLGKEPQTYLNEEIEIPRDLSKLLIEDIPFSIRTKNVLKRENIITVEDLVNTTMEQLIQIKLLGKKSIKEIEEFLNKNNLKLNNYMNFDLETSKYDIDNYLDLFIDEISKLKDAVLMHTDGIGFTENIINGESIKSYVNGNKIVSKIEYDENRNVISFTKKIYINEKNKEININVTKDEIKITKK